MFKTDFVDVAFDEQRKAVWTFQGPDLRGTEFTYSVVDRNYAQRNRWSFVIRVPDSSKEYTGVLPTVVPNRKIWAGLERRSLQFGWGDIGKYKKRIYAKITISDVNREKNKVTLTESLQQNVPKWIKAFQLSPKRKVAKTRANDGHHLVASFEPEDHRNMILLFLALKAWVLDEGYAPSEARRATVARQQWKRAILKKRPLKGLRITVTGALKQGIRSQVLNWLRSLGAHPDYDVTGKTDLLIRGPHYKGDDRKKIKKAKQIGVTIMTEGQFYRRYID